MQGNTSGTRMEGLMRGRLDHKAIAGKYKGEIDKRGHRPDMAVEASADLNGKRKSVRVAFNRQLGRPSDAQFDGFVASAFPGHEINWKTAKIDEHGMQAEIRVREERVPVPDIKSIPQGFERVASATYVKRGDKSFSVWRLEKDAGGLCLVREQDETTSPATNEFKANQLVRTPEGDAVVILITGDRARVRMPDGTEREHGVKVLAVYESEEEKKKMVEYYTKAYGDAEYARKLVYGE